MRYAIKVLEEEHKNIIKLTDAIQGYCLALMAGQALGPEEVREIMAMIRNYADRHHHEKEEAILFAHMTRELGVLADKLITYGMLTEHSLARLAVMDLDQALQAYEEEPDSKNLLDIIGFLMTYRQLLIRHAGKEDQVVYPFALKNLSEEVLDQVDEETRDYEEVHKEQGAYWQKRIQAWYEKYGKRSIGGK